MIINIASGTFQVAEMLFRQPKDGLWRARVKVPTAAVVDGESATLSDDVGNDWIGTARGVILSGENAILDLIGGAGQWDAPISERYYSGGVSVASLLADLCNEVGETAAVDDLGLLPSWRVRGVSLREELMRLSSCTTSRIRVTPGGLVSLSVVSGNADSPGIFTKEVMGARIYETSAIAPVAGLTLDDWEIGVALWDYAQGRPLSLSVWQTEPARALPVPAIVGAVVLSSSSGRVTALADTGVTLVEIPLWSAVGVYPDPAPGSRVLVLDLGGDPRATLALAGAADSSALELVLRATTGQLTLTPTSIEATTPAGPIAMPLVRTGDQVTLTIPGLGTVQATVGPSISMTTGQPSVLKSG